MNSINIIGKFIKQRILLLQNEKVTINFYALQTTSCRQFKLTKSRNSENNLNSKSLDTKYRLYCSLG